MQKKLSIDVYECIACGNCENVCPAVFKLDENLDCAEVINPEGASEERNTGGHQLLPYFMYILG